MELWKSVSEHIKALMQLDTTNMFLCQVDESLEKNKTQKIKEQ